MAKKKIVPNEVKQKVRAFITSEKGKVSKQSLVSLGAFLGSAAVGGIIAAKSVQAGSVSISMTANPGNETGEIMRIVGSYG